MSRTLIDHSPDRCLRLTARMGLYPGKSVARRSATANGESAQSCRSGGNTPVCGPVFIGLDAKSLRYARKPRIMQKSVTYNRSQVWQRTSWSSRSLRAARPRIRGGAHKYNRPRLALHETGAASRRMSFSPHSTTSSTLPLIRIIPAPAPGRFIRTLNRRHALGRVLRCPAHRVQSAALSQS